MVNLSTPTLSEHTIEVENLAQGEDFKYEITRAQFEEVCQPIFDKCLIPFGEALNDA